MNFSKLKENLNKNKYNSISNNFSESLFKGACVKIKNSQKTFQVIGLNPKSKVCWLREWPLALKVKNTFPMEINQITLQTFCTNQCSDNPIS